MGPAGEQGMNGAGGPVRGGSISMQQEQEVTEACDRGLRRILIGVLPTISTSGLVLPMSITFTRIMLLASIRPLCLAHTRRLGTTTVLHVLLLVLFEVTSGSLITVTEVLRLLHALF